MSDTQISQSYVAASTVAVSGATAQSKVRIRGFILSTEGTPGRFAVTDTSANGTPLLQIPAAPSSTVKFFELPGLGIRTSSAVVFVSVPTSGAFTLLYDGG